MPGRWVQRPDGRLHGSLPEESSPSPVPLLAPSPAATLPSFTLDMVDDQEDTPCNCPGCSPHLARVAIYMAPGTILAAGICLWCGEDAGDGSVDGQVRTGADIFTAGLVGHPAFEHLRITPECNVIGALCVDCSGHADAAIDVCADCGAGFPVTPGLTGDLCDECAVGYAHEILDD